MNAIPFRDLMPARDAAHARWVSDAIDGCEGVGKVSPGGYDAYLRIHHPPRDGSTWAEVAPSYLRRDPPRYDYPFPDALEVNQGNLDAGVIDALTPVLALATSTPRSCHYALWGGWGELHAQSNASAYSRSASSWLGKIRNELLVRRLRKREVRRAHTTYDFVNSCAIEPGWGGRDKLLFDGPVEAVQFIGSTLGEQLRRRSPQWWWPDDRAWFVANEIDHPWTYLAGTNELVQSVARLPGVETVEIQSHDGW